MGESDKEYLLCYRGNVERIQVLKGMCCKGAKGYWGSRILITDDEYHIFIYKSNMSVWCFSIVCDCVLTLLGYLVKVLSLCVSTPSFAFLS